MVEMGEHAVNMRHIILLVAVVGDMALMGEMDQRKEAQTLHVVVAAAVMAVLEDVAHPLVAVAEATGQLVFCMGPL